MAGAMRKMAVYLGLVEDEPADDFDDDYEGARQEARMRGTQVRKTTSDRIDDDERLDPRRSQEVRRLPDNRRVLDDRYEDRITDRSADRGFDRDHDRIDPRSDSRPEVRPSSSGVRPIPDSRGVRTFPSGATPIRRPVVAPVPDRRPSHDSYAEVTRIETIHPRNYNDARHIGEVYREGTPVIMNLTELDDSDAKRIIDFAAGLVFGQHGAIERVTSKVFLLSPPGVDVGDAARAQVDQPGFYNQS